jgi:hypothetical protein
MVVTGTRASPPFSFHCRSVGPLKHHHSSVKNRVPGRQHPHTVTPKIHCSDSGPCGVEAVGDVDDFGFHRLGTIDLARHVRCDEPSDLGVDSREDP